MQTRATEWPNMPLNEYERVECLFVSNVRISKRPETGGSDVGYR